MLKIAYSPRARAKGVYYFNQPEIYQPFRTTPRAFSWNLPQKLSLHSNKQTVSEGFISQSFAVKTVFWRSIIKVLLDHSKMHYIKLSKVKVGKDQIKAEERRIKSRERQIKVDCRGKGRVRWSQWLLMKMEMQSQDRIRSS